MKHDNNFDLLRLFAASQVVFVHTNSWLNLPAGQPFTLVLWTLPGVPIFFIISGFLVMESAMRSSTLLSYFRKRALRIYPALIANIIGMEIIVFLSGQLLGLDYPIRYMATLLVYMGTASLSLGGYVSHIPQMYEFGTGFLKAELSGVLWTLTVELSFYMVVPLIAAAALRSTKVALALLVVVFAASATFESFWTLEMARQHSFFDVLCPQYLWIFAIGMIARVGWKQLGWLFEGKAVLWVGLYVAITFYGVDQGWFKHGIEFHIEPDWKTFARVVLLGCAVLSVAFTCRRAGSALKGVDISYGIYLWHMPIVVILLSSGLTGHWWLWICVYASVIVAALCSWIFIERPALRLKERNRKPSLFSGNGPVRSVAIAPSSQ